MHGQQTTNITSDHAIYCQNHAYIERMGDFSAGNKPFCLLNEHLYFMYNYMILYVFSCFKSVP